MADLERRLLVGDLDLLQSDLEACAALADYVDDLMEDREYRDALYENKKLMTNLGKLSRDLKTFRVRWEELKTANAEPDAEPSTPEAKAK